MVEYERGGSYKIILTKKMFVDVGGHLDAVTRCDLSEDLICGLRTIAAPHAYGVNDRHFRRKIITKNPPCWCMHWSYSCTFYCVIHYMYVSSESRAVILAPDEALRYVYHLMVFANLYLVLQRWVE